jgi:hypothetical protein
MQVHAVHNKLAVAMDIKAAVDGHLHKHDHHPAENRGLHELLVSDLDAEFEKGTPPSREKLVALFDRKVRLLFSHLQHKVLLLLTSPTFSWQERMEMHHLKPSQCISEEEQLWSAEFDRAVDILEK